MAEYVMEYDGWADGIPIGEYLRVRDAMHERRREEVVRCKDCKNAAPHEDGIECLGPLVQTWDYLNDQPLHNPVQPDGFCAWGVRRESEWASLTS